MRQFLIVTGGLMLTCSLWGQGVLTTIPATNATILATNEVIDVQAQVDTGLRALQERKYANAADCFQRAIKARPEFPDAYDNWGIALVQMAKQSVAVDQQLQLYQEAAEKFSKAAEQRPNDKLTQLLWGEVLVLIGDMPVDGRVRLGCYQGAIQKYRTAASISPNDWETYNRWGSILSTKLPDFAVDDKARVQLYKEAAGLFAKAAANARFSSEVSPLYSNWGSVLVRAARLAVNFDEKSKLLAEAIEKFEHAAKAMPNVAATYSMWGNALIEQEKMTRLRSDLRDAIDRLQTSLSLNPKDPPTYYNLARAYCLLGNNILALDTLNRLREVDPNRTLLMDAAHDADFSDLWKDQDFQDLINPVGERGVPVYNPPMRDLPR